MKRFSKYYQKSLETRRRLLGDYLQEASLPELPDAMADHMIENYIMNYEVPLGLAPNIQVDEEAFLLPLAIEEPSVVAALSYAGKLLGPIHTEHTPRSLTGQIIFSDLKDSTSLFAWFVDKEDFLLELSKDLAQDMVARGGGPRRLWWKEYTDQEGSFASLYIDFDPVDAMGANSLNTVLEGLAQVIEKEREETVLMAILSNYSEHSLAKAQVKVEVSALDTSQVKGSQLAYQIMQASRYAHLDPYRAVTHNKGIMNGVGGLALATGNDWRAIEAAVHAYAAHKGRYEALSQWKVSACGHYLEGSLTLPLPVGTVGGTVNMHPQAQWCLDLLGRPKATRLARIMAAVGLLQNFAALRALVTEGIQAGHMNLHASSLAIQVGAKPDEVPHLVQAMKADRSFTYEKAHALLQQLRLKESQ